MKQHNVYAILWWSRLHQGCSLEHLHGWINTVSDRLQEIGKLSTTLICYLYIHGHVIMCSTSVKQNLYSLRTFLYLHGQTYRYVYLYWVERLYKNNNWERLINGLTSNYYSLDLQRYFAKVSWWTYNTIFVWRQRVKYIRNCSSLYRGIRYPLYLFCIEICNVPLIVFLVLVKKWKTNSSKL